MTKNNKAPKVFSWKNLQSLKNIFLYFFLAILIFLAILVLWKQYKEKQTKPQAPAVVEQTLQPSSTPATPTKELVQPKILDLSQQLITIQLFEGILEGWIPLNVLKTYLQKNTNPESQTLLLTLAPLMECPTYEELFRALTSDLFTSKSLWERIKSKAKSLINIKKIEGGSASGTTNIKDVEAALGEKNLQKALTLFENLPNEDKESLAAWKQKVQERLKIETLFKGLLLKLSQGQNG
ncbi:MAG: hypothetical protein ACD_16C00089G0008 [uncultured bacterium]|nr:MAG: hypothetical protein ACD_16C00089G0008 [uncultured bacterium]OFW68582.1 MAG: hypothetical protein A2X70_02455 [Alphaproteobacteria bacterium GWC2_42_16]OFW73647.1 MAG: hypothetical protein A2Z80_02140 [Alphaproteobacteria bacterium GWA2_41_27]OFW81619.1 MAG: hypothetical protein A3E50_06515 [Alphaproteobacteria bacterium RIFCSPHIGHO2_12_FULL_42_100]OFW85367.1 MAG: hypothetical protein A2W06_03990 [Alphaproteobacteria bacterium RBG_16_42_14]OFW90501.1 MAG: hypothetical protein A3C41_063